MGDHDRTARGIVGPLALVTPMSGPVMREVIETVTEALDAAALAERKRIIALVRAAARGRREPSPMRERIARALLDLADELEAQS